MTNSSSMTTDKSIIWKEFDAILFSKTVGKYLNDLPRKHSGQCPCRGGVRGRKENDYFDTKSLQIVTTRFSCSHLSIYVQLWEFPDDLI